MINQSGVLVLGGGPGGAATALLLARHGCPVTLVEREIAPKHKVCGEFLSVEALHLLEFLGIDPASQGAPMIDSVRLAAADRVAEARLPFPARSLTRRCLDGVLLAAAEQAGACVLRGQTVEALTRDGAGWRARLSDGSSRFASRVVLATGKHDLRGFARPQGSQGDLVALKMYFQLAPDQAEALKGLVELFLYRAGYAGLQLVEDGSANLCALMQRARLASVGGWQGLLHGLTATNKLAAQRLGGAVSLLEKPLAVSPVPYGFVRRRALGPGLYAVGDQAAVIPSFTGDGMSLALYTGVLGARSLLAGEKAERFQHAAFRELRWQVFRSTVLSQILIHPALQPLLSSVARRWPHSLRRVATMTRLAPARRGFAALNSFPEL